MRKEIKQISLFEENEPLFVCNLCKKAKSVEDYYLSVKTICKKCCIKKVQKNRKIYGKTYRETEYINKRKKTYIKKFGTLKGFEKDNDLNLVLAIKKNIAKGLANRIERRQKKIIDSIKKNNCSLIFELVQSIEILRDVFGDKFFLEFVTNNFSDIWNDLPWSNKNKYFLKYHLDIDFNCKEKLRRQVTKKIKKDSVMDSIRGAIIRNGDSPRVYKELGFTISDFKKHFENLFEEGMTWEKFIDGEIHIDHIIPQSFFDCSNKEEYEECFSLKNLQPLWAKQNMQKSNKIEWRDRNEH